MQTINVYDSNSETAATKLKNALVQYAPGYFDSYDTDFTGENNEKIVQCKIGQEAAVEIQYNSFALRAGGKTLGFSGGSTGVIAYLYVLENAILFVYKLGSTNPNYSCPILLCKKKNGDTALVFFTNNNVSQITGLGSGSTQYCCVLSVSRSTGAADFAVLPSVFTSNNTSSVTGFSVFSLNDGGVAKDVFLVINSDFRSHTEPFDYTLGDVTYTGIAGNYLAVKGT